MSETATNPLLRALAALDGLEPAEKADEDATLWQEARQVLIAALEEREAFLAIVGAAAGLIDLLDDYKDAVEAGDEG